MTGTTAATPAQGKLDLGRVARDTFAVTGRRPGLVVGLALLLSGLPTFFGVASLAHHLPLRRYFLSGAGPLQLLVAALLYAFLAASLYRLAISELQDESPTPAEIFTEAAQLFLPLFAVRLIFAVCVALGMILLIVPGVMLALAWCVAGPVLVAERTGITECFRRSAQLTRNNRWRLLGLFVLFGLASSLVQQVFNAFGLAVSYSAEGLFSGPRLVGSAILATITAALAVPGLAAIYVQLRELKGE